MSGYRSSLLPHIHSWREQGQGYFPLLGCGFNFIRVYIIIIMFIIIISFMQGIYTYIPETNSILGIQFCSYFVVSIHGAYIVSYSVQSIVLLHW